MVVVAPIGIDGRRRACPRRHLQRGRTVVTNDLLPENNDVTNCIGTVEPANCGSKARADGHTYLVFLALIAGLAFIGGASLAACAPRDNANKSVP